MKDEVEGVRPRGRPKKLGERLWKKTGLNREDAMDRIWWMKQIRDD